MKRFVAILLSVLLIFSLFSLTVSADDSAKATVKIGDKTLELEIGDTFTVKKALILPNDYSVQGGRWILEYDSEKLEALRTGDSYVTTDLNGSIVSELTYDEKGISFAFAANGYNTANTLTEGKDNFATFTFKVLAAGEIEIKDETAYFDCGVFSKDEPNKVVEVIIAGEVVNNEIGDNMQNEIILEAPEKVEHELTAVAAQDATCTEAGNTAYWVCDDCGKYFSDSDGKEEISLEDTVVAAKGHTTTHSEAKDAACTESGNIEYWECSVCDKRFSDEACTTEVTDVNVAAKGHTTTHSAAKDAACTESGNIEYWECSVCDKRFSDEACTTEVTDVNVAAKGHDLTHIEAKDATYEEEGNIEYWHCKSCDKYFSDEAGETEIALEDTIISKLIVTGIYGDADGNAVVNSSDAVLILQYFSGIIAEDEINLTLSDVDNNTVVNASDAAMVLQRFAGIISEFPIENAAMPVE